jgi:hypothetical protein
MTQTTVQLPKELYDAVRKRAAARATTPDALVAEWVSAQVDTEQNEERRAAFEQEIAAFEEMKPTLLKQYSGQYVGIHQGQVVAVGPSRVQVVKDIYERLGQVVCYVEKVSTEPLRRVRIPSAWKTK